ncbi:interferon alpha/beta receptor 1a-like isoform X1 [Chiloscyllium plagiosum]|uniref:interferon alpha/beta receptor 1a-like isoform X1 n=1 Tax=Chiloscyllium plagiosum TaxID=36176 RepID=UPI001CB84267|nr:interferon alpha/beta receptor 1a-like isoform X1 [Chiloscyllium plagiosum]
MSVVAGARPWAFILTMSTLQVLGEIPIPTNLQIHAYNLKYELKWDDVQRDNYSVSYTVQRKRICEAQVNHVMNINTNVGNWADVKGCKSINETQCDLTSKNIHFFGSYTFRLRAQQGNQTSAWLKSACFAPYKHNKIGPPSIQMDSNENTLNVYISDLQTENSKSIQKTYKDIKYRIIFWKKYLNQTIHVKNSTRTLVSLELEPWTTYCLRVQIFSSTIGVEGQFSEVVCHMTKGTIPLWQIGVTFIISLVVVFGVTLGCLFCIYCTYRCIKYAFFPPHILPEHLQEYFSEPTQNAFIELAPEEDAEECCDQLKVIFETENLSTYSSSLTLPNTGNEISDDNGQTSTDSGQFSNEGSSNSNSSEESEGSVLTRLDLQISTGSFYD